MGSSTRRRKNVQPLPGGGAVVSGSGQINLGCAISGKVAASPINLALSGEGLLELRAGAIVLTSVRGDMAILDQDHPLFDRLASCLAEGFDFAGVLSVDDGDAVVDVRSRP